MEESATMKMIMKIIGKIVYYIFVGTIGLLFMIFYTPIAIVKKCRGKQIIKYAPHKNKEYIKKKVEITPQEESLEWIDKIETLDAFLDD